MKTLSFVALLMTISVSAFAAPQDQRLSCEGQAYHSTNRAALEKTYDERSNGFVIGRCIFNSGYTQLGWRSVLKANNIIIFEQVDTPSEKMSLEERKDRVLDILQDTLAHCGC